MSKKIFSLVITIVANYSSVDMGYVTEVKDQGDPLGLTVGDISYL